MKEYQVYYDGRYLDTIFCNTDEQAKLAIVELITVTKISIATNQQKATKSRGKDNGN